MVHALVAQSEGAPHVLKSAQRGQAAVPPQSTSDSPWFLTPSVHEAAAQRPAVHTPVTQSVPVRQMAFTAQRAQSVPPQSTSDSVPFRTVSVQLAATQELAMQIRLTQSVVAAQRLPLLHAP